MARSMTQGEAPGPCNGRQPRGIRPSHTQSFDSTSTQKTLAGRYGPYASRWPSTLGAGTSPRSPGEAHDDLVH